MTVGFLFIAGFFLLLGDATISALNDQEAKLLPLGLMAAEAALLLDWQRFRTTLRPYVNTNAINVEPWVTETDVARHLGVVKDTVYRWREHKSLPAHKIGRLWKFQLSEVDEWVRAGGADNDT